MAADMSRMRNMTLMARRLVALIKLCHRLPHLPLAVARRSKLQQTGPRDTAKTQTALLAPDAFAAVLGAICPEDWGRTWAAEKTIMLRRN